MANSSPTDPLATQELPFPQRHLIQRPRLTKRLDEAEARIIMLVAPAGYGKTTLAHEWTAARGRRALWFRARSGAADVAAVARGLSAALEPIFPGVERSIRELLTTMNTPEEEPGTIAELLVEEIGDWPRGTWLVIDEYELMAPHAAPATLVERFVEDSGARILITSRDLPAWIAPRDRLYGDVFELGRAELSMSVEEAAQVLAGATHASAEIVELADGWPAVIGLAALLPAEVHPTAAAPSALFDYVAQELFDSLDADVQHHLPLLALPSTLTRSTVRATAGDASDRVVRDSVRAGLMTIRDDNETEIHPLCRAFLTRKLTDSGLANGRLAALTDHLIDTGQWDDAFDVIRQFRLTTQLQQLFRSALRSVLAEGRLATVERWAAAAEELGLEEPELTLARAEIYLRHGNWQLSETLASSCAPLLDSPYLAAQAYLCAGMAAYLVDAYVRSERHYTKALEVDDSPQTRRSALWGQFVANIYGGRRGDYKSALDELERLPDTSAAHLMRIQQALLLVAEWEGRLDSATDAALSSEPLLAHVEDPFARMSFMESLADTLVTTARYRQGEKIARMQLDEASRFRVSFVPAMSLLNLAAARVGAGDYAAASSLLEKSQHVDTTDDAFLHLKRNVVLARLWLCRQESHDALRVLSDIDVDRARVDIVAEALATRALAEACTGDHNKSRDTIAEARSLNCAHFSQNALFAAALAIGGIGSDDGAKTLLALAAAVRAGGYYDSLICALRADRQLLNASLAHEAMHGVIQIAVRRSGDVTLASAIGVVIPSRSKRELTTRELEVLRFVAEGFHNDEIAQRLFISPKTVKTHLQNIYEKLEARSRTEAAMKAKERGLLS